MLIKYVYIVFMGMLLATFIGVGIAAFYKGPNPPDTPISLKIPPQTTDATQSALQAKEQQEYDLKYKDFQALNEQYNKNVSIIALIFSVIMVIISLTLFKQILVLAEGLLLGGVITLGYAVVTGFGINDEKYRFIIVTLSLIITFVLGYIKFVRPQQAPAKK